MKKFFFAFLLLTVSSGIPVFLAFAEDSPAPEVDDPLSPVDADKALITGTTEPGARIQVTGGPYDLPSETADADGNFSVLVALIQESTNTFYVVATVQGYDPSEPVTVTIVEGAAAAQEHEAETGEDRTAPDAPEIEETNVETDENTYTIEGTGEAAASILVNGVDSGDEVNNNGSFSTEVALTGDGEKDSFSISLQDEAGNVSAGIKVYVTSSSNEPGEVDTDEDATDDKTPLTDISGHWAEDYINELYNLDVVSGYSDGRFGPDDKLTRAQIVKIALLAFEHGTDGETNPFTDLSEAEWYYNYVLSAAELEIVSGYSDKTFRPDSNVTRAEALKIVLTAGGITDFSSVTPNFSDVDTVNDWYAKYTAYAKDSGLIGGYSDGTFKGNQNITRAEVCKIVVELMESLE